MPCYINIEDRYRLSAMRERQMLHTGLMTGLAIAGTVVSTGAAVYGGISSSQAARRAAGATGKAGREMAKAQQRAFEELRGRLDSIQAPQWNLGADISDAERITGYNQAQLERLYPGATSQREVASRAISDYMQGVIPQDVQQETMRNVAELAGAGFRPQAGPQAPGGFQAPQALLSRNLGLTSLNLQQAGMGLSMEWQKLAGAFIESPLQVGQARLGFEKAAADLEMQKAAVLSGAQSDINVGNYGRQMNTIAANLAAQNATSQGIANIGSTFGSGLSSIGTAYSLANTARSAGTIDFKGQEYGNVKGFGGETYRPAISQTGGLYYKAQPQTTAAARAFTGAYGYA